MQYKEEYRKMGGIEQYLLHFPAGPGAPVLLFVHGGPGVAESCLGYLYSRWWDGLFTVVHWDQRGAGKTRQRNRHMKQAPPTMAQMMDDLFEVVQLVKAAYRVPRVVLLGHSWGSLLGSLYALRVPGDVALYIGVGQNVAMQQSEAIAFEKLKDEVAAKGTPRQKRRWAQLAAAGPYPPQGASFAEVVPQMRRVNGLMRQFGMATGLDWRLCRAVLKSPTAGLAELKMFLGVGQKANDGLREAVWAFDLQKEPRRYAVPVCYILGERDYQTATPLAQAYFQQIEAPEKACFVLAGAGHNTMFDAPEAFAEALAAARKMVE
ncbi:MAG: alpha/beta hydrolase [Oscillospiraceae bacterium]